MKFKRLFPLALLCAILMPVASSGATSAHVRARPAAALPPRATLTASSCVTALSPSARSFSITAVMRPLVGTEAMAVKFDLLQKLPGAVYAPLRAPGLGSWISPTPATLGRRPGDVWRIQHPVADLPAPARYRFRVTFRWSAGHNRVLETVLFSAPCAQPELRPDLVVEGITVRPGQHPRLANNYLVTIGDHGATGAGPFTVALNDAGGIYTATVPQIAARGRVTVKIAGPVCQSGGSVTADPDHQVNVYTRDQATMPLTCPAPSTGTTTSGTGTTTTATTTTTGSTAPSGAPAAG